MQRISTPQKKISVGVMAAMALFGSVVAGQASAEAVTDAERNALREQIKRELFAEMKVQMAEDVKRQVAAELAAAGLVPASPPSPGAGAPGSADNAMTAEKAKGRVVRVPYVPESMKREIRDQLKTEVLAQAKEERWGNPGSLPEWLDRFSFEGDVRLRADAFRLSRDNTAAGAAYWGGGNSTRAADLAGNFSLNGLPNLNTQDDFERTRLRLRFGATAKISDAVSAGFRIATGNTSGPTSTNQTMGQGFNKYSLMLDRGYLSIKPTSWLSLSGGRIANPFFGTDLVWADDLNFEGIAAQVSQPVTSKVTLFGSAGWFPLRTDNPLQTSSRDLTAVQAGLKWRLASRTDLTLAAAFYNYNGIVGQQEDTNRYQNSPDYGVRYEYPDGLRQRGNTLFVLNPSTDTSLRTFWGLASGFKELNLTGSLDIANFDPVHVVLTGDFVKNLAFDRSKIATRTGANIQDGKDYGYLGKISVGYPSMTKLGDWNVSLAYRWLGSDAVLDAFTNSDFGLGGTNSKGYILGGSYGIDKNTWLAARWMSSNLIDSMAPKTDVTVPATKLSVDLLQVELNSRF